MANIFVTYGNEEYYPSLERIKKEAEVTKLFDKILIFTDRDLPEEITSNETFQFKKGGGYWIWKPWVTLQALKEAKPNDIVVWSDAGNTIFPFTKGWLRLFKFLKKYNGVFFYNGGTLVKWTRKSVFEFFGKKLDKNFYQIIGSFFLVNKGGENLIKKWYELLLNYPELIQDVQNEELHNEDNRFIEHRHDQAVLSALLYTWEGPGKFVEIPEKSERIQRGGQPIHNTRKSKSMLRNPFIPTSLKLQLFLDYIIKPGRRIKTFFLKLKHKYSY